MKKAAAILLALVCLLSASSCGTSGEGESTTTDPTPVETPAPEGTELEKMPYYQIRMTGLGVFSYEIYNKEGTCVLSDETSSPLNISMLRADVVDICIGKGTGIALHRYYDVSTDRLSDEYSYVVATSAAAKMLAFVEKEGADKQILVVRDIFDDTVYYKEIALDFLPSALYSWIENAWFSRDTDELVLTYRPNASASEAIARVFPLTYQFDGDGQISETEALQIASAYWRLEDGASEGAAGTRLVHRIVVMDRVDGYSNCYHIAWQIESYHNFEVEGEVLGQPYRVKLYRELLIDDVSGVCRVYIQNDGK